MNSPSPLLDALTTEELRMSFQYTLEDLQGLGAEPYLTDGTSTNSSGSSPVFQLVAPVESTSYEPFMDPQMNVQLYNAPYPVPVVEFTDLTSPYPEDRRRRRSQPYDKQTLSSMHMRRRAQNRASQRAFRERKEKHAQDLQKQLDEMDEKYKELQAAHDLLKDENCQLKAEVKGLKNEAQSPTKSNDALRDGCVPDQGRNGMLELGERAAADT